MDQITFNVVIEKNKFFNVEIFLNNIKIPHYVFNTIETLAVSLVEQAEFDLFTCTCGVSGCAGFQSPIYHKKIANTVQWLFSEDYNTPKKLYIFNINQFNEAFAELYKKTIANYSQEIYSMCDYECFSDSTYDEVNKETLTPISVVIDDCVQRLNLESKFISICNKHMPFFDKIYFEYDGYKANCSASDLARMIINEWPRTEKNFYWLRLIMACNAVNELVLNKNSAPALYLDNRTRKDMPPPYKFNFLERLTFEKVTEEQKFRLYFNDGKIYYNGEEQSIANDFTINNDYGINNLKITY